MHDDLFKEIDDFALAFEANRQEEEQKRAISITRAKQKIFTRRANSEAHLAKILPQIKMGNSYHIISRGDVDAMTFLIRLLAYGPIEMLTLSTGCMAMPDVNEIETALRTGMIGHCKFLLGEIFPNQYADEYLRVRQLEKSGNATVIVARNHSKVMIGSAPERDWYFAIESSANVNTNPRIEQTAIHMDKQLHDFYDVFFNDIKDIDKKSKQ